MVGWRRGFRRSFGETAVGSCLDRAAVLGAALVEAKMAEIGPWWTTCYVNFFFI